jgi:hypothetical protein
MWYNPYFWRHNNVCLSVVIDYLLKPTNMMLVLNKRNRIFIVLAICSIYYSCQKKMEFSETAPQLQISAVTESTISAFRGNGSYTAADFTPGLLTTAIVPPAQLFNLGGSLSNNIIAASNNTEIINQPGWLFRPPTNTSGQRVPLSGNFNFYLYHDNRSGQQLYLHLFISNPNTSSIAVSALGSIFTSNQYSGFNGHGFGPSYQVALNTLNNSNHNINVQNVNVPKFVSGGPANWTRLALITLPDRRTIDGRLSLKSFSSTVPANCYVYLVASTSTSASVAFTTAQTGPQAVGTFVTEDPNEFGRELGIYSKSGWAGATNINLPATAGHLGLCINTTSKFAIPGTQQQFLQDQNAPAIAVINGAASKTYGNYGHYYDLGLNLTNNTGVMRRVKVYFASNITGSGPSFTYHGPLLQNGVLKELFVTPTAPKQLLADWQVPPGLFDATFKFYIPGLITANSQLVVESQ